MKLLVTGHGKHGKGEVADILWVHFGLYCMDSSWFACKKAVYPYMMHLYDSVKECHDDRRKHREFFFQCIQKYNTPDRSRLAREILQEHDVYVGMRCKMELEASRHLFGKTIWIDASEREEAESENSMTITKEMCDIVIPNNGNKTALLEEVYATMASIHKVIHTR